MRYECRFVHIQFYTISQTTTMRIGFIINKQLPIFANLFNTIAKSGRDLLQISQAISCLCNQYAIFLRWILFCNFIYTLKNLAVSNEFNLMTLKWKSLEMVSSFIIKCDASSSCSINDTWSFFVVIHLN